MPNQIIFECNSMVFALQFKKKNNTKYYLLNSIKDPFFLNKIAMEFQQFSLQQK